MSVLLSLKLRGLTAEDATLGTVSITLDSDNLIRFTGPNGVKHAVPLSGDLAVLIAEAFKGPDGIPAALSRFGRPQLSFDGDGTRVDN